MDHFLQLEYENSLMRATVIKLTERLNQLEEKVDCNATDSKLGLNLIEVKAMPYRDNKSFVSGL
jgi:hypothetical protein